MTITGQIKHYLEHDPGTPYCDNCLKDELGLEGRQAQLATPAIGSTGHFKRDKGICFKCGKEKKVTWVPK
jgi:hypothetical protein